MPPKAVANGESACTLRGQALTSSEVKILFGALNNLTAPLDIDLQGAAETAGLKPNSYKEMYRQFRRKYELGKPNAAAAATAAVVVASGGDGSNQPVTTSTGSSSSTATPKKAPGTAGGSGGGRPRARPKKMLLTPGVGGGTNQGVEATLATPGTPMGNLNFNDMTPETPSKKAFGTSNKRSATEANPDETPAKKGPAARKPRVTAATAKQKAVAAAAAQAETKVKVEAATDAGFSFIGDFVGNDVDAAMEGISQAAEAIEDTLAAAAADEGYITATEGGGPDYGEI
ncbi:hypothetical protein GE21DRAFT_3028 [Neurospora crassa]|uniref:Uncharacterized protein n=2 Tax=Neurospora crassa TaxID=5141 RepID=Q1K8Q8_NEUCR|nr:hypothetical protein NCU05467 [Neurospora crassa OR74A]EAA34222.1 hypothetical protein NCU05467 [Neurospora crassa OR74A]KHE85236.1 hypothetical protein GE21DRAFT_3028 [Neurospora crassa]CAB97443.1 related to antifreeze glycopeptide AFGP polyprotein precursor [Neurospora crassa]|eukprot:XP_963458.1 hypothetical protein NCU05467 [Neurospora crassa OR74A]